MYHYFFTTSQKGKCYSFISDETKTKSVIHTESIQRCNFQAIAPGQFIHWTDENQAARKVDISIDFLYLSQKYNSSSDLSIFGDLIVYRRGILHAWFCSICRWTLCSVLLFALLSSRPSFTRPVCTHYSNRPPKNQILQKENAQ